MKPKTNPTPLTLICIALILSLTVFVGGVVGAENMTVNETNETVLDYSVYDDWYKTNTDSEYYLPYLDAVNGTLQPTITKQDVIDCLFQDKSDDELHNDELALMGMTDKLERFINAEKVYIEETGEWAVKYDYSFWDNIFSFFGNKPDVYTDYYEARIAEEQYNVNYANFWCGEKSKHLLLLEESIDE